MKLSDFDFSLPEDLIALRPMRPRPASRLLVAQGDRLHDRHFRDLGDYLRPGDHLVLNDTRVLPARLYGQRLRQSDHGETRAAVEVTLLSLGPSGHWRALAKPARRVAVGEKLIFAEGLSARVIAKKHAGLTLSFNRKGAAFDGALAAAGSMPLPPYIASRRAADAADLDDYQTVFAARPGAVAAPTASLHFDKPLLAALETQGISFSKVTLHVGAGTFLPVKADDIREHKMHAEWGEITAPAAAAIDATRAGGGRIIPVGTTALRLLETAARDGGGTVRPWVGETDIFITPGFDFQATDGLITNFHLPKSTLMMLVSALMGIDRIRSIYAHAIASQYRFFSYGDGSLLLPGG